MGVREPHSSPNRRSPMRKLRDALRRLDDSWIGDLLGAISLFGLLYLGLFAGLVFGGQP
jgi:hypothetical protein